MHNFPDGCCDDSCDLLSYYLLEECKISTKQGIGRFNDGNPENATNYAWLVTEDEVIIDITFGQFKYCAKVEDEIYVGRENSFYCSLDHKKQIGNYNTRNSERLWSDYQIIVSYF